MSLRVLCLYLQRVSRATTVEAEQERLRDSTLQSTLSNKERKEDAQKKKTATQVRREWSLDSGRRVSYGRVDVSFTILCIFEGA